MFYDLRYLFQRGADRRGHGQNGKANTIPLYAKAYHASHTMMPQEADY